MNQTRDQAQPGGAVRVSARTLWLTTSGAIVGAALIVIALVMPAEHGIDPTGIGERLGLMGLSQQTAAVSADVPHSHRNHTISFELSPYEFVEFKYLVEANSALLYSWTATSEVLYDFHGHPDKDSDEGAVTHKLGRADHYAGTFIAPFTGVHGWYWENRGATPVTVTVQSAGYFERAFEWRDRLAVEVALPDR